MIVVCDKMADDGLKKQEWRFWVSAGIGLQGIKVVLDKYVELERKTSRHKFTVSGEWARLSHDQRRAFRKIENEEISIPPEIERSARDMVEKSITFHGPA